MYTIKRDGKFNARLVKGTAHCGAWEPVRTLRYHVEITVEPSGLDHRGFVLDNGDILDYFDKTYTLGTPTTRSCEAIAEEACLAFEQMLGARAASCERIAVTIWPREDVEIGYSHVPKKVPYVTVNVTKPEKMFTKIA